MGVIAIVLVLGGLIFFHELGHFLVARMFGIGVKAFALGFGPKIASFRSGMTEYRLCAVPLGGYVMLAGESPEHDEEPAIPKDLLFSLRPVWQRMCVVAAGPVFNFLLAWGIYWALFATQGQMGLAPTIGQVLPDSPAARAGLKEGDNVLTINGRSVTFWDDLTDQIQNSKDRPIALAIKRDREHVSLEVTPELRQRKNVFGETVTVPMLGIVAAKEIVTMELSAGQSLVLSAKETWRAIVNMVMALVKMIERVIPAESIGGPILIAQLINREAQEGIVGLLALAAALSANLGFVNLLPIPVLDGGHLVLFSLEAVTRKPLSLRARAAAMRVGIALLAALMLFATYNDLRRLFQ
ncbi:regulator of sigma E protease [Humidesulfovibrio mexicanus]|uniref:Zinc metalloprotease n=1 Tax=Humidesulfovibrio mexicanus TaxID=147047 RepID=A0A238Y364_9BACT|nr:RIP metalloprotease RseP [Humidesulfovibrio mexicanus]SNR64749.1 regulator of sigma E protease [Humidesulfovibrio mexicanus]